MDNRGIVKGFLNNVGNKIFVKKWRCDCWKWRGHKAMTRKRPKKDRRVSFLKPFTQWLVEISELMHEIVVIARFVDFKCGVDSLAFLANDPDLWPEPPNIHERGAVSYSFVRCSMFRTVWHSYPVEYSISATLPQLDFRIERRHVTTETREVLEGQKFPARYQSYRRLMLPRLSRPAVPPTDLPAIKAFVAKILDPENIPLVALTEYLTV